MVLHSIFRVFIAVLMAFILAPPFILAEESEIDPSLVIEERTRLESELEQLEVQIEGFRSLIRGKQKEATSFERDIAILDAQIDKARLEIRARNLAIGRINNSIGAKSQLIEDLIIKIGREKASLAELIRRLNEIDQTSLVEILLSYDNLSDFFIDIDNFDMLQGALQISFDDIRLTQTITKDERDTLETRKAEEVQLRTIQQLEKERIEERETEKQRLLDITKGKEAEYQKFLSDRQKNAAQIRSQLFLLRGSPDIPFEEAVEFANMAFRIAGVRPAFLLGVIAEESNLGANVGTGNWKQDLSHPRCKKQREAFASITYELGLIPDAMPVSKRAWYGYCGGAMGPAQFMPTTWLLYKGLVSDVIGGGVPDPWNPRDAFIASALLLRDNGAAEGTYSAERRAALRYLAGGNWSNPRYGFYGDDVMALARKYQEQIDIISR